MGADKGSNNMVCLYGWLSTQAESLGTKILDEDGLLELIRTKPGKKSKYEITAEAEVSSFLLPRHLQVPSSRQVLIVK